VTYFRFLRLVLGCDRVYTEDLTHGQVVDGLAIVNPFR